MTSTQIDIDTVQPFSSTIAFSGIPISSKLPANGDALVLDTSINQFVPQPIATAIVGVGANTFLGPNTAVSLTTGTSNTGIGSTSLEFLTSGTNNTAVGYLSLDGVSTGTDNTAVGSAALSTLGIGSSNIAIGAVSLPSLITGTSNIGIGYNIAPNLTSSTNNILIGDDIAASLTTGSSNICIGSVVAQSYAGTESANIAIGQLSGVTGDNNSIRIGIFPMTACFISGISGVTITGGATNAKIGGPVGQMCTLPSARRYKQNIVDAKNYSSVVSKLKVKNFVYNNIPNDLEVGLIAEEVEEVVPELVVYDKEGLPETVKYDRLIPILLQKIQKLNRKLLYKRRKRRV